jgi:hypothetical protein
MKNIHRQFSVEPQNKRDLAYLYPICNLPRVILSAILPRCPGELGCTSRSGYIPDGRCCTGGPGSPPPPPVFPIRSSGLAGGPPARFMAVNIRYPHPP